MNKVEDINVRLKNIQIKIESGEDPQDAALRRFKEKGLLIATLVGLALVFFVCILFAVFKPDSVNTGIALNSMICLTMVLSGYCMTSFYVRKKRSN